MRLRDKIINHVLENASQLQDDYAVFSTTLSEDIAIRNTVRFRLRSMAFIAIHTYGLQNKDICLFETFVSKHDDSVCTVYGLFVNTQVATRNVARVLQVSCFRDTNGNYDLTTRVMPPSLCPPELTRLFAFAVSPRTATGFPQKCGDFFEEKPTSSKRLYPNANSRTFRYEIPILESKDAIGPKRLCALNNMFAMYSDRVVVKYVTVPVVPATHVWWAWNPRLWQGPANTEPPVFLSFTHVTTQLPRPGRKNASFLLYCFDECDSLSAVSCPTFFLSRTVEKSRVWRSKVESRRNNPTFTNQELLDVNELRAKP